MRPMITAVAVLLVSPALAQTPDCAPYLEQVETQLEIARGQAPETADLPDAPKDADRPVPQLSDDEVADLARHVEQARQHLEAGDHRACMTEVQSAQAIAIPVEDSIAREQDPEAAEADSAQTDATGTGQSN